MPRKPIDKRQGPHLDARQACWEAIRKLGEFTLDQLECATFENRRTLKSHVNAFEKGGYIKAIGKVQRRNKTQSAKSLRQLNHQKRYKLVKNVGYHAPRLTKDGKPSKHGRGTQAMWLVMKVLSDFDFNDLAEAASGDDVQVAPRTAQKYIQMINKAGYLQELQKGKPGRPARYALIESRWSGPLAPMIQLTRHVYDPNKREVVWGEEVAT